MTVKLPLITRPFAPDCLGTYSKRVDSNGVLNVTLRDWPKLSTPYGVCHNVFGLLSNA